MKKLLLPTLTILICTLVIAVLPTDAEAAIYDDTVRLHILANSDTGADQELKIAVRDAVLKEYGEMLSGYKSAEEAAARIEELLPEIEEFARAEVSRHGYNYSVNVTLTKERYGTREYEKFTLPGGVYTSLRIIIGEGSGQNWWCVMYPPMCLGASIEGDGAKSYTREEKNLISRGSYKVKFKILELISENFT